MPWFLILNRPRDVSFEKVLAETLRSRGFPVETWTASHNLTWIRTERLTAELVDAVNDCPGSFGFASRHPIPVSDEEIAKLQAGPAAGTGSRPSGLLGSLLFMRPALPPPPPAPPLAPEVAEALRRPSYEARRSWRITTVAVFLILAAVVLLVLASLTGHSAIE